MSDAPPPLVSVCIASGRRSKLLERCLASLQEQEGAPTWELVVVADGDPAVLDVTAAAFPDATMLSVDKRNPGAARNAAIAEATGDFLLFLDDDVTAEPDLLATLARLVAEHPGVDVFGGPNLTPDGSSTFEVVQGAVLGSIVASGPVRRRYGRHPATTADERYFILCNLAIRRTAMLEFATELVCAEENQVLHQLRLLGHEMRYDPSLAVDHARRSDYRGFSAQLRKYGRGRGQVTVRHPSAGRLAYLLPSALLAYLVASPLLAFVSPLLLLPAVAYLVVVLTGAGRVGASLRSPSAVPLAAALIATVHLCYGLGVVHGVALGVRHRLRAGASPVTPAAVPVPASDPS